MTERLTCPVCGGTPFSSGDVLLDSEAASEDILARVERSLRMAAADRALAATDRAAAGRDRVQAARERELAATDELTGARVRSVGLADVSHEIERAHRNGDGLTLAFVDVNQLKAVNDSEGHLAGDALLARIGEMLRATLRSYDVIVRYGGDEFICAIPNLGSDAAAQRLEAVTAALTAERKGHGISFGLAELEPNDNLEQLIARADDELIRGRRSRVAHP
jgi:diguanylate cyclase (GGDEF)-like protein